MPSPEYLDSLVLKQPSLPKARQWLQWLDYHLPDLPQHDGWERCVRDTLVALHHAVACSARRLRGNPTWDLQGTMTDDTEPLEDAAQRLTRRLEFLKRNGMWQVPERFERAMDCLYGACRQQIRLAREIDQMRAAGKLEVDVQVDLSNQTALEQ